jgi:putative ABC transport system permease protein
MFTLATYLLQDTVRREVRAEGPGRQGNLFLLDVRDTAGISHLLSRETGVKGDVQLVGYIVARMLSKNGLAPERLNLNKERRENLQAIRITTARALPEGLSIRKGHWWPADTAAPQLAVSEQAQRDFKLKLGDQLTFQIAGRTITAPLVAVFERNNRAAVRYDLVLPHNAVSGLPVVYYGAVHVDPARIPAVEEAIFEKFPTVTVMNLADVLTRIQEAVDQVALVVRFLALFAILAGIIILSSSVAGTRYRRMREVAILKALGATRRRIQSIFSIEFSILGAIAGLVGALLANGFSAIIADRFIETHFDFNWPSLLIAMPATALLANAAGWLASTRMLDQRPLEVLRSE